MLKASVSRLLNSTRLRIQVQVEQEVAGQSQAQRLGVPRSSSFETAQQLLDQHQRQHRHRQRDQQHRPRGTVEAADAQRHRRMDHQRGQEQQHRQRRSQRTPWAPNRLGGAGSSAAGMRTTGRRPAGRRTPPGSGTAACARTDRPGPASPRRRKRPRQTASNGRHGDRPRASSPVAPGARQRPRSAAPASAKLQAVNAIGVSAIGSSAWHVHASATPRVRGIARR